MCHSKISRSQANSCVWLIHRCDRTHPHVWHDLFIGVKMSYSKISRCHANSCVWLIHMCDRAHPHVWHDLCIGVKMSYSQISRSHANSLVILTSHTQEPHTQDDKRVRLSCVWLIIGLQDELLQDLKISREFLPHTYRTPRWATPRSQDHTRIHVWMNWIRVCYSKISRSHEFACDLEILELLQDLKITREFITREFTQEFAWDLEILE